MSYPIIMKISNTEHQSLQNRHALIVVSGKEHGKIYEIKDGNVDELSDVEVPAAEYSDNEGFFTRGGNGQNFGSGAPREEDDEHNLKRYSQAITSELNAIFKKVSPKNIYVFEPEHLKGTVAEYAVLPNDVELEVVEYGNFVQSDMMDIVAKISEYIKGDTLDPADPASVAGEENAEEKRKILETGQRVSGE